MKWMTFAVLTLVMTAAAIAAEPQALKTAPSATALDQQIRVLLLERDRILSELDAQLAVAASEDRAAIEQEYSALQSTFEIQVLELMVQYYDLTGNVELRERAATNLAQLQAPAPRVSSDAAVGSETQTTEGQ